MGEYFTEANGEQPTKSELGFIGLVKKIKGFLTKKQKILLGVLLVAILVGAVFVFKISGPNFWNGGGFGETYSLVGEKISKSAVIAVNLPSGVDKVSAISNISFDPPIKGEWIDGGSSEIALYKPDKDLEAGSYYAVSLKTSSGEIKADFLADENPKIESIFPSEKSEISENSKITIVFNRPMVPLTTLSVSESKSLPITIYPETQGRWKWISTRNLQFMPNDHLKRSSNYEVRVGNGLVSVEGLEVKPQTAHFSTRPLRYQTDVNQPNSLAFDEPVSVYFNQPIDLEKTLNEVQVKNTNTGNFVPIVAEYGLRTVYNPKTGKDDKYIDKSILNIYQKADRNGRQKLWDFKNSYSLQISKAYPEDGDIILNESRSIAFYVFDIVQGVSAKSARSSEVSQKLFDPEGELTVTFFEDIDTAKSDINAIGLRGIKYGEKCVINEAGFVDYGTDGKCLTTTDKKTLVFSFDPRSFSKGQNFNVELKTLFNVDGIKINFSPIIVPVTVYPEFKILSTVPDDRSDIASVQELVICSNTPIKPGVKGEYAKSISTKSYIVFGSWQNSFLVSERNKYFSYKCAVGEYETRIRYGLLPETAYVLNLNFSDEFNQSASKQISFKTPFPDNIYYRLNNLQKVYNVTSPDKTTLTYSAENLEYIDLNICKVSAESLLSYMIDRPDVTVPTNENLCQNAQYKKIQLPKKYWVNNYFQINLRDYFPDVLGHYIITLSNPLYRQEYGSRAPIYDRTFVSVTNLAVGSKRVKWEDWYSWYGENSRVLRNSGEEMGNDIFWVTKLKTLEPVSGVVVSLYNGNKQTGPANFVKSSITDEEGIARNVPVKDFLGAIVSSGSDSAIISDWADNLQWSSLAMKAGKTYVYTDRPIYRPGQEVFLKGIDRVGYDGSYEIWKEGDAKLKIFDSRGNEIYSSSLPITAYGTFSTSLKLPANASLGTYRIEVLNSYGYFDVEEYEPSAFDLKVGSAKDEYVSGETMKLDLDTKYYFGAPVKNGKVSYTVTSQDYYFDRYQDEYFNFGADWYYCYNCGYGDSFLFRGAGVLDENGKLHLERKLDFSEFYKNETGNRSKIFVVNITVTDSNGRSVSNQKSFIVHRGEVYLGVKTDKYFVGKGEDFKVLAKSVDVSGAVVSKGGIDLEINKVTWQTFKRREVDGGFYYKSEKQKTLVKKKSLSTNGKGNWSDDFKLDAEGQYEISLTTSDSFDNKVTTFTNLYVYGDGQISVEPTNDYTLSLETEKKNLKTGETAKLIIKSPYKKAKALITVERGKIFDYKIVSVDQNLLEYSLPIKVVYAPNIFVSVLLISDQSEIKFGQIEYKVGQEKNELKVSVEANKTHYLPGEKVVLNVKTTDNAGVPVPADLSISVADLSVLALKGNPKKNPLIFFYDGFPLTVTTGSNIKNILYEKEIPVGTKGGGGGGDAEDLAKRKRGIFADTAFWQADVITNANGEASVSFTLPDNLTTWQIESVGVTKDTKLGVNYKELMARKDVMVVPIKPRFVVPGDEFMIGAQIFNQTDEKVKLDVTVESSTLKLSGGKEVALSIAKGESETVYFNAFAPKDFEKGVHQFTLSAKNSEFEDVVTNTISVTPNNTYEAVATANTTKSDNANEYVYVPRNVVLDKGGMTINANATMAVFLGDALNYLVSYPYGCSEQLASKLSSIAIVQNGLGIKNVGDKFKLDDIKFEGNTYTLEETVKRGLDRIYENQTENGGFSYYKGLEPDYYLTLHVLGAMKDLRSAGYFVNADSMTRAGTYLISVYQNDLVLRGDKENAIFLAYTLSGLENLGLDYSNVKNELYVLSSNKQFLNEKASSLALGYFAVVASRDLDISSKDKVFEAILNKVNVDGRGAYLKTGTKKDWQFYETPIKNTALLLKAIAVGQVVDPRTDKIIRWLLNSRSKDNAWGSTNNTLAVIDAMTDYLKWQKETESVFNLKIGLSGEEVFNFKFNKNTVLQTMTGFIPTNKFGVEKINKLSFAKENLGIASTNFYYDMVFKYFLPIENISPRDEGITIERTLSAFNTEGETNVSISSAKQGDVIRGKLTITIPENYNFVSIEDFIPAGFELVNFNLSTADQSLNNNNQKNYSKTVGSSKGSNTFGEIGSYVGNMFGIQSQATVALSSSKALGYLDEVKDSVISFVPDFSETRDDRLFLFKENVPPGVYEYEYYLRALVPGKFQHLPAVASEMYYPEIFGRTGGGVFEITK